MANFFQNLTKANQFGVTPLSEGLMAVGPMLMAAGMGRNAPAGLMGMGVNQVLGQRQQNQALAQRQFQNQMARQQLQMQQQAAAQKQKQQAAIMNAVQRGLGGGPAAGGVPTPTPSSAFPTQIPVPGTPGFNPNASTPTAAAGPSITPQQRDLAMAAALGGKFGPAMDLMKPQDQFQTVQNPFGRGGVAQQNVRTGQITNYQAPVTPGKPSNYQMPDGTLRAFMPNDPALPAAINAGAILQNTPQVQVNTGKKIEESILARIEQGREQAVNAIQSMDRLNRMSDALNDANVGPTSTLATAADRIAVTLGIGGENTADRLAKTQEVVKGLSQMTLNARGALKGQGQISDREQAILEKAVSGDASELTRSEIQTIMDTAARAAQAQYSEYQDLLGRAGGIGSLKDYIGLYSVKDLPEYMQPNSPLTSASGGANINNDENSENPSVMSPDAVDWLQSNPFPSD